jgi:hypothetical protein
MGTQASRQVANVLHCTTNANVSTNAGSQVDWNAWDIEFEDVTA